jgi:hypothetical protein
VWCCEAPKYSFCQNHSGSQWFCQPHRQSKHRAIGSKERNNLNPLNLNPIALKRCNDYRAVWSKCKIQLDPLVLRSNSSCAAIVEDMTTITRTVIQFHIQQNASPISNKCTEAVGIAQYPNTQWKL